MDGRREEPKKSPCNGHENSFIIPSLKRPKPFSVRSFVLSLLRSCFYSLSVFLAALPSFSPSAVGNRRRKRRGEERSLVLERPLPKTPSNVPLGNILAFEQFQTHSALTITEQEQSRKVTTL